MMDKISSQYNQAVQLTEKEIISLTLTLLNINRQPTAGDLDWHEFFSLGFIHHMEILSKT